MRLRRIRGITQAQLARKLKTKQPAIARLESGRSNPQLSTLVDLAEALGATIRVEMQPLESIHERRQLVPWWEPLPNEEPSSTARFALYDVSFTINNVLIVGSTAQQALAGLEPVETVVTEASVDTRPLKLTAGTSASSSD